MAASDLLAGTVMDKAASLMNDTARTVYTYSAQIPYLQMAIQELQEYFELHNVPVVEDVSVVIQVDAGQNEIVYNGGSTPSLPNDMVEPLSVWERTRGIDPFVPMRKVDFLPLNMVGTEVSRFMYYVWQGQKIKLLATNQNNDVKIQYTRELFTPVVDQTSILNVVNAASFLEYRTAGLLAEFIERNQTSANSLNQYAALALDRSTGINVKGKQNIMTRRRPFRSGYKMRGWVG